MQLSIIIPMYNATQYILTLLDSIYQQASYNLAFEVIIIDDCSIDNSLELVQNYLTTHNLSNLKIIQAQSNQGTAATRNLGLTVASGMWIQFVDSDDTIASDYFLIVSNNLNPEIDCFIYGQNVEYTDHCVSYEPMGEIDQRMIGYRNSVANKIYKRSIIDPFDIDYDFEDVIWLVKLIGKDSYTCQLIPNLKYNVNRKNTNSKMANFKQEEWKKMAVSSINIARKLNHYARAFVLETFVGTVFTPNYKLTNRLYVGALAICYHYKMLPLVIRDGIRNKSRKKMG